MVVGRRDEAESEAIGIAGARCEVAERQAVLG
jgi:hypothetical protein